MALKKTVTTAEGLQVVGAYHKVGAMSLVDKTNLSFQVTSHKEQGFVPFAVDTYHCTYNLDGKNPISQAYDFLKSSTEKFAGAEDC